MKFIRIRTAVLVFSLILAASMHAQEKTDIVVMKNGDRMTCEIKGLEGGVLFVSLDYVDGTIAVEWSKVARLESRRLFIVRTEGGRVYHGKLSTVETAADQPLKIEVAETDDEKVDIDASRVVEVDVTAKRFIDRLNGDISFGATFSKGNQSTQYNINSSVEYPSDRWSFRTSFSSNLSAHDGSRTSKRNQLTFDVRRLLRREKYFLGGVATFLQSDEQGINLQSSVGAGVGRFLKNSNRARITLLGGLAFQNTSYDQSLTIEGPQKIVAAMFATQVRVFRFKKLNFDLNATFLPSISERGRVFFKFNQSFYVKLFSDLTWNVSFYGDWDNRPPGGLNGSDFGTSTGVGWTFGNR